MIRALIFVMAIGIPLVYFSYHYFFDQSNEHVPTGILGLTWYNYADDVEDVSIDEDLPFAYLMSLIAMESSGLKPAKHRYEKHVFRRLKQLRDGEREKFENLRQEDVADASDEALKNLASSWGPFQIMGYKCVAMGIKVKDLRGGDAVKWGARWIKNEYGDLLARKRYKDAFHVHNTGRPLPSSGIPQTHNPAYLSNGMKYINYFEARRKKEQNDPAETGP